MGYGLIVAGGPEGRYTLELDRGEAQRLALVAALTAQAGRLQTDRDELLAKVAEADAKEAAQQALVAAAYDAYAALANGLPAGALPPESTVLANAIALLKQLQMAHGPLRLRLAATEFDLAATARQLNEWQTFPAVVQSQAWCCDYTETAGGYVATVEIPGEPALTLVAPGGRPWAQGDGTITEERKAAALAWVGGRLGTAQAALDDVESQITAAEAAQTTLAANLSSAQTAYLAVQNATTDAAVKRATKALSDKQFELSGLRVRRVGLAKRVTELQQQQAYWTARPASAEPDVGDGYVRARELMSPAQAFFNAALLPGWQRWRPTYRWGVLSGINWDDDTADVQLAEALSSAQRLPVNHAASLSAVPVSYMHCDARCFSLGERVVVRFRGQEWSEPEVIGYLDTPRPCPPTFGGTIPPLTFTELEAGSFNLAAFWTGGKPPLNWEVVEGELPAGMSIDSAGLLSGTPTTSGSFPGLVVRCSDALYELGSNRRYEDSNVFEIEVEPAWEFLTPVEFEQSGGVSIEGGTAEYLKQVLVSLVFSNDPLSCAVSQTRQTNNAGTNIGAQLQTEGFVTAGASGLPALWYRMSVTGSAPTADNGTATGPALSTWHAAAVGSSTWSWVLSSSQNGRVKEADYTLEIARDAAGSNIVSTITGAVYVEHIDDGV